MKRIFKTALLLTASMFAQLAAHAGEMTLFSHDNFHGRQVTVRETTPNLNDFGFNDRASSLIVRSGRWEVCSDADFRGYCAVFERGEYAALPRFNDRLSSVREIGRGGPDRDHGPHGGGRGSIELFTEPGLRGNSTRLDRDSSDFVRFGFNDRTDSVRIEGGNWQLCSDAEFRGTCRVFGPGRHDKLGPFLSGRVSSARMVDDRPSDGPGPDMNAPLVLFSEEGMRGRPLPLRGDTPDFVALNANDVIMSVLIQSGNWQFCSDSFFRGQCRILGPGQYPRLAPELSRAVSSVRQVAGPQGGDQAPLEMFSTAEFGGRRIGLSRDTRSLDVFDFNDQAGSMVINEGEWMLCVHADFGGDCMVRGPGRYANMGPYNNQLSSVRRIR